MTRRDVAEWLLFLTSLFSWGVFVFFAGQVFVGVFTENGDLLIRAWPKSLLALLVALLVSEIATR